MSRKAMKQALEALEKLWNIIDDIDTYGDMAKADDKLYRSLVERRQRQRFEETGISTDGYELHGGAITALRQALANEALDKMAENARELGLDYEPADEPVAWICENSTRSLWWDKNQAVSRNVGNKFIPLYTRPQPAAQFAGSYGTIDESAAKRIAIALGWEPKREWVALTQQDIDIAFDDTQEGGGFNEFARAIEQRLKEKNT